MEDDPHPLEGQGAHRLVVAHAALAAGLVEAAGPGAVARRGGGELMEALARELGAGPAEAHRPAVAAAAGDRGDAGETGHVAGPLPAAALRAEEGQQARGQRLAGAGQRGEERVVGMPGEEFGDAAVQK